MHKHSEIYDLLKKLKVEKNVIQEKATPLRAERDRLLASIQPTLDKIRELEEQYRSVEQPRLAELDNQISALTRILGGKRMSDGRSNSPTTGV